MQSSDPLDVHLPSQALRFRRLVPACGLGVFFVLAVVLAFSWSGRPVQAEPLRLYVSAGGSDANPCTVYAPCRSIQRAVSLIPSGGEIRVAAGTYTGTVVIAKDLTLRGGYTTTDSFAVANPVLNRTVIDAQNQDGERPVWIQNQAVVNISGFDLTGGRVGNGAAVFNEDGTLTLEYCRVYSNTEKGSDGGAIASGQPGRSAILILRYNEIYNNISDDGSGYGAGGGVFVKNGTALIEGNRIHHNSSGLWGGGIAAEEGQVTLRSNMIYSNSGVLGGAIFIYSATVESFNDTLYDNAATNGGGVFLSNDGAASLVNALIVNNKATTGGGVYGALDVSYSDFWGNVPDAGYAGGTGNRYGQDPQFVNPATYDLHLQSTSPARDSGTPADVTGDFEGQPRPYGSGWDRGADEYVPAAACYARIEGGAVYTNVQSAIDAAPSGGTVQVAGVCVPGAQSQIAYIAKSLTLRGGYTLTDWSRAIYGPTRFDGGNTARGVRIVGGGVQAQIENLWIQNGTATNGAGVAVEGGANAALYNLILVNNTAGSNGGGIYVANGSQAIIRHNTLYQNGAATGGGGIYAAGNAQVTLNSSIVASNTATSGGSGLDKDPAAICNLGYNDLFNNTYGSVPPGSTDLTLPPGFVNQAAFDLRLDYTTSNLINAADPASPLTQDAQGYARPLGSRADIGAFESLYYADVALSESPNEPIIVTDAATIKGTMIPFTHTVTNVSIAPNLTDTFEIQVGNSMGWQVALVGIAPQFVLTQGHSLTFYVHVTVPIAAPEPFYNRTWVTATVKNRPSFAVVEDEIGTPRIELAPSFVQNADPGQVLTYTHVLTNAGPVSDTVEILFSSSLGWSTRISPTDFSTITLQPGESVQIRVQVDVPPSAAANLEEIAVIQARSLRFDGVGAQVTDRTIANPTTGDRYVAPGGSNTNNNCTQKSTPCASIAYAVEQAVWGDNVLVAQGTYYERDIRLDSNISLRGGYDVSTYTRPDRVDPTLTVIDAQGGGRGLQINASTPGLQITVDGLTLRNTAVAGGNGGSVHIEGNQVITLSNILIENSAAARGGGIYVRSGQPILAHVTISNTAASIQGGGLYIADGQVTCSACVIGRSSAVAGGGIYINGGSLDAWNTIVYSSVSSAGHGGGIYNGSRLSIFNATLVGNTATGAAGGSRGGGVYGSTGSNTAITNTIVVSNTASGSGGGIYLSGGSALLDYNDFWANAAPTYPDSNLPIGTHSITADPLFVNSDADDFHLTPDSPCVDTADPNTGLVVDFEDDLRPANQGYDIGADELSGCLARVMTPDQSSQVGPIYGVLQEAVDAAPVNYVIQVSGICRGVQTRNGIAQTVMITKALTLIGGFNSTFEIHNPLLYTTTLDAQGLGRVLVVTDLPPASRPVTVSHMLLIGGNAVGQGGGPGGSDAGGGVYVLGPYSMLFMHGALVVGNRAVYGGGAYVHDGVLRLDTGMIGSSLFSTQFVANLADQGGGLYNGTDGRVEVYRAALMENIALVGGGIYNQGSLSLINSLVVSNTAVNDGGGLYNVAATLAVRHDTFFGNQAGGMGGGIYQGNNSTQPVINSTLIVSNTATTSGGGIYSPYSTFAFDYNDLFGNLVSGVPGDYGGAIGAGSGTGNISANPLFITTTMTSTQFLRIPAGSPAEDAGDPASPVADDIELDPRPSNQYPDIGADEVGGCYVRNKRTGVIYGSIQRAVDQSQPFDLLQVAGACRGVNTRVDGGQPVKQTVFLNNTLTIEGGYTRTNWSMLPEPATYPTYLDAVGLGRVAYVTGTAQITLTGLHLTGGNAQNGGAIWVGGGTLTVTKCYVHGNQAERGGAAYTAGSGGKLLIGPQTEVMTNTADYGGGVYAAAGQTTVDGSTFYSNTAVQNGGALYSAGGVFTVTNNVIRNNSANLGAALYNASGATLKVWHNTIYGNSATNGGGLYTVDALLDVRNNLVVSNTVSSAGHAFYSTVSFAPPYNNVIPTTNAYGGSASAGPHTLNLDPMFVDLSGGDFHIQPESPVRNQGDPTMTLWHDMDQDVRPGHQGFDMGADEIPSCRARIRREPEVIYGNPQWAIYHSQPGDVIEVTSDRECEGVHSLTVGSETVWQTVHITHSLTLIGGYDEAFADVVSRTVLNPQGLGRALMITNSAQVTVSNFILQNGRVTGTGLPSVRNVGGALFHATGVLTLTNSVMHNSQATYGGALYNQGTLVSWNTIVYSNTADGGDGGGLYDAGNNSRILHNVFYQNHADNVGRSGGGIYAVNNNATIFNTIFVSNTSPTGSAIFGLAGISHDYNDYVNNRVNIGGSTDIGPHSLTADPKWVNPENGDFHLSDSSPMIDMGQDRGVTFDIDDDPRPINTAPDIGADEYNACLARIERVPEVIYGRIQEAIDAAINGDTIQIAKGICYESLVIDKSLVLSGNWTKNFTEADQDPEEDVVQTTIDGRGVGRVATVNSGINVEMRWVILQNGGGVSEGGGIRTAADNLSLNYVYLISNTATYGGGIYQAAGKLNTYVTSLWLNTATDGGGLYQGGGEAELSFTDIGSYREIFSLSNQASNRGGGVYIASAGKINISASPILGNRAADGGGIYNNAGTLSVINNRIIENEATGQGGGAYLNGGNNLLINVVVYTNTAGSNGGGIYRSDSTADDLIAHNNIYENHAGGSGGGVYNMGSSLPISASIVASNTAGSGGSGVWGASTINVAHTLRWNNTYGGSVGVSNELVAEPVFRPSAIPYLLHYDSPAIDAVSRENSDVTEDRSGDPRNGPYDKYTPICAKDMGADEYMVEPNLDVSTPQPASAEISPTQTISYMLSFTNTSIAWNYVFGGDKIQMLGPGYTETVYITLTSTYPEWSRIVGFEITSTDGTPVLPGANVTIAPDGRSASLNLHPSYRANMWISVTVPLGAPGEWQDITTIQFDARVGMCADALGYQISREFRTDVLDDYSFVIEPDRWGIAQPGETITYVHTITNLGNLTGTFLLYPKNGFYAFGEIAEPISAQLTLTPGMSATVVMSVTVYPEAAGGLEDITNLIGRWVGPNIEKSAADRTSILYISGVRYVSIDGQDSLVDESELLGMDIPDNNCTQPTVAACRTLRQAISQAAPDDIIQIASGVYSDLYTVTHASEVITQVAYISKSLTLRGGYLTTDWDQVPGEHVTHTTAIDPAGNGRGIYIADGAVVNAERLIIRNGAAQNGAGIYGEGELTMQNVFMYDNQAVNGGALYFSGTLILNNNTFFRNSASGTGSAIYLTAGSANLVNNIIATHTVGNALYVAPGASLAADYTLYHNNLGPTPGGVVLTGNPAFLDPAGSPPDLHLSSSSPAINAGMMVGGLDEDYDNDLRPLSAVYDIGADEYVPRQNLLFYPNNVTSTLPASTVVLTHTLHNDSEIPDTVILALSRSPAWTIVTEPPVGTPIPLDVGEQRTVWVTVTVPLGTQGQNFTAWITATSQANPIVQAAVRDEIRVRSVAWEITKTVKPGNTVQPGDTLTYTITVTNVGDLDSYGYNSITDRLPQYTHLVSADWGSVIGDDIVWYTDVVIHVGESYQVTFVVTVSAPLTHGTAIVNDVYSIDGSGVPRVDGHPVTVTVYAPAQLSISKAADHSPVQPGDWLTYTLTVTNSASAAGPATNVLITDTLPPEVVFGSMGFVAPASGSTSQAGPNLTWSLDQALQPGESAQVTVTVRVTSPLNAATLTNRYGVSSTTALVGSAGTLVTPISTTNAITLSKSAERTLVNPGDPVTYTIVLTNNGTGIATVTLNDLLDPAFTPNTWSQVIVVPGRDWSGTPGVQTLSFIVTAPTASGLYYNRWITATYDSQQVVLQDVAPVRVMEPLDGLMLVNDSPTAIGQSTTLTASLAAGVGVTYTLDLGDGSLPVTGIISTGTPVSITHTYPAVGVYTATITATDGAITQVAQSLVFIEEPVAGLVAVNDSPTELGNPTTLTATVTAGSNVVLEWDLGDGTIVVGDVVTHTYGAVGVYTAVVTASNSVSLLTATTTITIVDAPIRDLALVNDSPTVLGLPTAFTATLSTGTNVSYTWDWGDGTPVEVGNVPTATHTYGAIGVYTATVTATNSVNSMTATTTVIVQEAVAGLTWLSDSPTVTGNPTTLTATISAGSDVTYTISLGDGSPPLTGVITPGMPLTITYTYGAPGSYTAIITVENLVSQMTATLTVLVEDPVAGLVAVNDSPTELGNPTTLTATVTAGSNVVFEWDLGDGTIVVGDVVTHTYGAVGVYTAVVTASNSVSLLTATTTITIVDAPIRDLALVNDSPTALGLPTAFTATLSTGTNVSYTWDWGDGTPVEVGNVPTATHTYGAIGIYTATVTATNSVNSMTATTTVIVQEAVAGLTWLSDSPTVTGNPTTLTATISAGSDVTYTISLGDGSPPLTGVITPGMPLTITYTYGAPGSYTAIITVENLVSQMTATLTVLVEDPVAGLVAVNDSPTELGNPTTLTATVTAGSNVVFEWDLGDGTIVVGDVVTHTYGAVGVYTAVVTASNSVSLLTATTTITIVDAPIRDLALVNDSPTVLGLPTAFTATLSTGTNVSYTWDWGDGTPVEVGNVPTATHTYGAIGVYTATVTATNSVNSMSAATLVTITLPTLDLAPAYSVYEDGGLATITVTLSAPMSTAVSVRYRTVAGTATADVDYETTVGLLTFAPGQLERTWTVPIYDDLLYEGDETVGIELFDATNADLGNATSTLTIVDNEGRPTVSLSDVAYQVAETGGQAAITVTLSYASVETITVDFLTADGTATAGADYGAVNTTLTFAPGETVQVVYIPIYDDDLLEGDETVLISVANPVNALMPRPADATLTIIDNESPVTSYQIYLPLVMRAYAPAPGRDLIVESITLNSANPTLIEVTIRNIGSNSVPYPFWVDLYVDPNPPPAQPNDLWNPPRCVYGVAWYVNTEIPAGGTLTLRTVNLDPLYSTWPEKLPSGTHTFYAQVDAYGSSVGMVQEDDETNNILGPVQFTIP